MKKIIIHVDRLVLNGVARADRAALVQALQDELTRQLTAPTTATRLAALGNISRLDAGRVAVHASPTPREIGETVGSVIAERLTNEG